MERLKYFVNGEFRESKTDKWYDLHNPSTGEVTGQAPCCTNEEVLEAIEAAKAGKLTHVPDRFERRSFTKCANC